jgi:chromosome segregation ATPase
MINKLAETYTLVDAFITAGITKLGSKTPSDGQTLLHKAIETLRVNMNLLRAQAIQTKKQCESLQSDLRLKNSRISHLEKQCSTLQRQKEQLATTVATQQAVQRILDELDMEM